MFNKKYSFQLCKLESTINNIVEDNKYHDIEVLKKISILANIPIENIIAMYSDTYFKNASLNYKYIFVISDYSDSEDESGTFINFYNNNILQIVYIGTIRDYNNNENREGILDLHLFNFVSSNIKSFLDDHYDMQSYTNTRLVENLTMYFTLCVLYHAKYDIEDKVIDDIEKRYLDFIKTDIDNKYYNYYWMEDIEEIIIDILSKG